jgi:hypothetical protein
MKKSIAILKGLSLEKGVLSVLLTILFMAAAQIDGRAQVNSSTVAAGMPANAPASRVIYTVPSGPFVTSGVAADRLLDAAKAQRVIMDNNQPGSPAYISAERRVRYFMAIIDNLNSGKDVGQAIVDAVGALNAVASGAATPEEVLVERNAAINLLRP